MNAKISFSVQNFTGKTKQKRFTFISQYASSATQFVIILPNHTPSFLVKYFYFYL